MSHNAIKWATKIIWATFASSDCVCQIKKVNLDQLTNSLKAFWTEQLMCQSVPLTMQAATYQNTPWTLLTLITPVLCVVSLGDTDRRVHSKETQWRATTCWLELWIHSTETHGQRTLACCQTKASCKNRQLHWRHAAMRGQKWPGMNCVALLACSHHSPYLEGFGALVFFDFIHFLQRLGGFLRGSKQE